MQYSLLSRFRGTLLGAALGDLYPTASQSDPQQSGSILPPAETLKESGGIPSTAPCLHWGAIATKLAQNLIQDGSHPYSWSDCLGPLSSSVAGLGGGSRTTNEVEADALVGSVGWAIAALPLMLCYHDHFPALRSHLAMLPGVAQANALVLGYTLARILQEQLNPTTLIAQILADLDLERTNWALADQLSEVQRLIRADASLAIAYRVLNSSTGSFASTMPVALALYCFLYTPEDFRLSLLRSSRHSAQLRLTNALVGAMSGCKNTTAGLPLRWRYPLQQRGESSFLLRARWGVDTETELLHLADFLLAHWAGFYHPSQALPLTRYRGAIAAPNVIRSFSTGP